MTAMTRRRLLALTGGLAALGIAPGVAQAGLNLGPATPFNAETVAVRARQLATRAHVPPPTISRDWRALSYDTFRKIWFDPRHALFRDTGGAVQADLLLAGQFFTHKITLNAVEGGAARPVAFDLAAFARTDRFPDLDPEGTGYAGVRLRGELEAAGRFQEYAVFQGASYFRAIGRGHGYGISARGLALGTGEPGGEEFPVFREFWIEAAAPGAPSVRVHALMDSPSVTGAYSFVITKGDTTEMQVSARLFPRVDLPTVGIAPGTSMFLFGGINRPQFDDFRAAVHDSDGLLMMNGAGEVLWRPLNNPATLQISAFGDNGPRGFGLMQRARDLRDYNDLEARYDRRPSLWVEPEGDWGPGSVILLEIPTDKETNDNIVAFWRPAAPLAAWQEHRIGYRLHWCGTAPAEGAVAPVIATRTGARVFEEGRLFAIDYAAHPALGDDPSRIEARVTTSAGAIS
ncbi:MAG TPA: glucan biosynthesis protein, partial [Paracoccaceae bacterium]|nr:glucan biosynthesis protein [Paracoccaceae bacterium]